MLFEVKGHLSAEMSKAGTGARGTTMPLSRCLLVFQEKRVHSPPSETMVTAARESCPPWTLKRREPMKTKALKVSAGWMKSPGAIAAAA